MPVACSTSALTGASGQVKFKPAGGKHCLKDWSDFGNTPLAADEIKIGPNGFIVGDAIVFTEEGSGNLDSALASGTTYYVVAANAADQTIKVATTAGGAAITLTKDGGTGTADTAGAANHIAVDFADFTAVCSVTEWSLSMTKDQTDVTTLPCSTGSGTGRVAPVRKQIGTFLNGEGSMSILFTADQTSMGQRLLGNSIMLDSVVDAKLYVDAVSGGATLNDSLSSYFEGPVTLLGFSISVNTSDAIIAEVQFSLAGQPKALFGVTI